MKATKYLGSTTAPRRGPGIVDIERLISEELAVLEIRDAIRDRLAADAIAGDVNAAHALLDHWGRA